MSENTTKKMIETKCCIACKEPIHINAVKCCHCEQFQNWRRHLIFSGIVLSLLIAFFSVIGLVIPVIQRAFVIERADLKLAVVSGDFDRINFILSNLGRRPAVIQEVTVKSKINGAYKTDFLYPEILGKVIEPNKSYSILTVTDNHIIPKVVPPLLDAAAPRGWHTCFLAVQIIHFDGMLELQQFPFKCNIPAESNNLPYGLKNDF